MGLSEDFWAMVDHEPSDDVLVSEAVRMVEEAPAGPERSGLLGYIYHDGVGVEADLDKAFAYAEEAAAENEGIALYLLGFMCEHAETPDQAEGGPRQKYDHYDAERFMERCAASDSWWAGEARLWLGNYYMDSARGGDPETAVEHFEAIGRENAEAACRLSDYYWERVQPEENMDRENDEKAMFWTSVAAGFKPAEYSYRCGHLCAAGIGCAPSFRLARKYFEDAYLCGQWEGAEAISQLFEERAFDESRPEDERDKCLKEAVRWHRSAEEMRLRDSASEPDQSVDDD